MELASQIICKNLTRRPQVGSCLWLNPSQDSGWREAALHCERLALFCQDHGAFSYQQSAGAEVKFGAFPDTAESAYDWIILSLPRQKALLQVLLDCAAGLLAEHGSLWLAGENKAGIKSADKWLKKYFSTVTKLDNARHCTLFEASKPLNGPTFSSDTYREIWELTGVSNPLRVVSYPGVFAHGRLDSGTALLLKTLPDLPIAGNVLDFGCGAGVIGASIKQQQPSSSICFLDSNALALKACRETLQLNDLQGTVLASNGLAEVDGLFDWIVSNPPIHSGVKTDNLMSMQLLEPVLHHLHTGGQLLLVANLHLPYEKWLNERFNRVKELNSNDHFKVLLAEV